MTDSGDDADKASSVTAGAKPGDGPGPADQTTLAEHGRPAESFLLADIERARDYRKEYYKYAIGIATSLLAFTIAFQPTLRTAPQNVWMEIVGWIALGIAVAAGLRVHIIWSEFFITFRDHDNVGQKAKGDEARRKLTTTRRVLDFLLLAGLLIGAAGVIGFAGSNLHNIALKGD